MVVARRGGGRSRWSRGRVYIFDREEVCDLAEGEEGSFDDGAGDRCSDSDARLAHRLDMLFV